MATYSTSSHFKGTKNQPSQLPPTSPTFQLLHPAVANSHIEAHRLPNMATPTVYDSTNPALYSSSLAARPVPLLFQPASSVAPGYIRQQQPTSYLPSYGMSGMFQQLMPGTVNQNVVHDGRLFVSNNLPTGGTYGSLSQMSATHQQSLGHMMQPFMTGMQLPQYGLMASTQSMRSNPHPYANVNLRQGGIGQVPLATPTNMQPSGALSVSPHIESRRVLGPSDSEEERSSSKRKRSRTTDLLSSSDILTPENDGLEGERRLVIDFESFGSKGELPQRFGKRALYIPNGLVGTHSAYEEPWRFEIVHTQHPAGSPDTIRILWRITNLRSKETIERLETADEADLRSSQGWTIASQVFREALKRRTINLEQSLKEEKNATRQANIRSLIKSLQPKTFTQGPLVFGLKHRIVQEKIGAVEPGLTSPVLSTTRPMTTNTSSSSTQSFLGPIEVHQEGTLKRL